MASILAELEDLPRFTGRETPQERLAAIEDYLVRLKDTLRYTLGSQDNRSSTGAGVTNAEAEKIQAALTQINAQLGSLSGRMTSAEERIRRLEDA